MAVLVGGNGSIVPHPGVVGCHFDNLDALPINVLTYRHAYFVTVGGDDDQTFVVIEDCMDHFNITSRHLVEHVCPVSAGVWPCDENAVLAVPLGSKAAFSFGRDHLFLK